MKQTVNDIIKNKDIKSLVALSEHDLVDVCISLVYDYFSEYERLNHPQKVLYLCMRLEDACQADTIVSLSEEVELFLKLPDMCKAYEEIGASKTSALIKQFVELLPDETFSHSKIPKWKWFFEDEDRNVKINDIDRQICHYPDGVMRDIYHFYISKNGIAEKLLENI